jgi:hypothetical protein
MSKYSLHGQLHGHVLDRGNWRALERMVENAISAKKPCFGDQVNLCSAKGAGATEGGAC